MAIKLSTKSGGGVMRLAPDLTRLSTQVAGSSTVQVTGINPQGALTEILSLTGKYYISIIIITAMTAETVTCQLTIDGVDIYNQTFTSSTSLNILGTAGSARQESGYFLVNSSLSLKLQTATDTSVTLEYLVRPIL